MWSLEQILALAPDDSSAKNGRALANAAKWLTRGQQGDALWGECQGSGKNPYQTAVELREPAFKCSCPSRKFPCKHSLGLLLLYAGQPQLFAADNPPSFCAEWLEKRAAHKELKTAKTEVTAEEAEKRQQAKAKRGAERERKVAAGFGELALWLCDLVRQGLAAAQTKPAGYWDNAAKRLIDAQAPGVARLVRELSGIKENHLLLEKLGLLFLLLEAYQRLPALPAALQAEVKAAVGFTLREEELGEQNLVRDVWQVVGQEIYQEDKLRVLRTWLRGKATQREALILNFAAPGQSLPLDFAVGTNISAELVYHPDNFPLRSTVKQILTAPVGFAAPEGYAQASEFLAEYARALARNPWLENFPAVFCTVVPVILKEKVFLQDSDGYLIPLADGNAHAGKLIALSGGREIALMGTWNGHLLRPLTVWAEGHTEQISMAAI